MGPGSTAMGITPYRFCIAPGAWIRQLSLSNASSGVAPRETSTGKSVHLDPGTRLLLSSRPRASGDIHGQRETGYGESKLFRDILRASPGVMGRADASTLLTAGSVGVFGLRNVSLSSTASEAAWGSVVTSTVAGWARRPVRPVRLAWAARRMLLNRRAPRDPLAISGNRVASPSGPVADVFHVEHVGDGAIFPLKH